MSTIDIHPDDIIERERHGAIDASERQNLEQHLAACSACRAERVLGRDFAHELAWERPEHRAVSQRAAAAAIAKLDLAQTDAPRGIRRRGVSSLRIVLAAGLVGAAAAAATMAALGTPGSRGGTPPAHPHAIGTAASAMPAPEVAAPTGVTPDPGEVAPAEVPARDDRARAPASAAALLAAANQARRQGDAPRAEKIYAELARRYPRSEEEILSRATWGRMLLDRNQSAQRALTLFEGYLDERPSGPLAEEALVGRALALGRLGEERAAAERAAWEALLRAHPDSIYADRARRRLEEMATHR